MKVLCCLGMAIGAVACGADKYAIAAASSPAAGRIDAIFADSAAPSPRDAAIPKHWSVDAITVDGIVRGKVLRATAGSQYAVIPMVTLDVEFENGPGWSDEFPAGTVRYRVTYSQGGEIATKIQLKIKPEFVPATLSNDNDLTVFGGINSAVGSKPTFKIDAAMDFHQPGNGFGINAKVKTDNRRKADPDSFAAHLAYRYRIPTGTSKIGKQIVFQGASLRLNFAGVEFDRKGKNLNFVSTPNVVLPFDFHTSTNGTVTNLFSLDLKFGLEAGRNFRNSLNPDGYGGFLRTLGGGTGTIVFHTVPGFTKVVVVSAYEIRLPNSYELFGTTGSDGITRYVYSKKARHWVSSSVNFFFNDHWSFSAEHGYGSLPPAFNFTDQQLSLGLKFALRTK